MRFRRIFVSFRREMLGEWMMSDFTTKFNLLIEIEEIANRKDDPLILLVSDKDATEIMDCGEVYTAINIRISNLDIEFYFDKNNKDGFHDLYIGYSDLIKIPYFRDMNFEDESLFILQDDYQIVKFIKLLEISDLENFLLELKKD